MEVEDCEIIAVHSCYLIISNFLSNVTFTYFLELVKCSKPLDLPQTSVLCTDSLFQTLVQSVTIDCKHSWNKFDNIG